MIGIDTLQVSRMQRALGNTAFKTRVFSASEIEYCENRKKPVESFAGLFCAKEAAVKALGTGFGHGIMPCDVVVTHTEFGAPRLEFKGNAVAAFKGFDARVSISHDGDHAVAAVFLTQID